MLKLSHTIDYYRHDPDRSGESPERRYLSSLQWGLAREGKALSWPLKELFRQPVVNDSLAGLPLLIFFDAESSTLTAFERRVGDTELTFRKVAGRPHRRPDRLGLGPGHRPCRQRGPRRTPPEPRLRRHQPSPGLADVPSRERVAHGPSDLRGCEGIDCGLRIPDGYPAPEAEPADRSVGAGRSPGGRTDRGGRDIRRARGKVVATGLGLRWRKVPSMSGPTEAGSRHRRRAVRADVMNPLVVADERHLPAYWPRRRSLGEAPGRIGRRPSGSRTAGMAVHASPRGLGSWSPSKTSCAESRLPTDPIVPAPNPGGEPIAGGSDRSGRPGGLGHRPGRGNAGDGGAGPARHPHRLVCPWDACMSAGETIILPIRAAHFFPLPRIISLRMSLRSDNIRASASPILADRAGVLSLLAGDAAMMFSRSLPSASLASLVLAFLATPCAVAQAPQPQQRRPPSPDANLRSIEVSSDHKVTFRIYAPEGERGLGRRRLRQRQADQGRQGRLVDHRRPARCLISTRTRSASTASARSTRGTP